MRWTSPQEVGEYDSRNNEDVLGEMIEARQCEIVTQSPSRFCCGWVEPFHRTGIHHQLLPRGTPRQSAFQNFTGNSRLYACGAGPRSALKSTRVICGSKTDSITSPA